MFSAGLCRARSSLLCVTPMGLSFTSQSRWAPVSLSCRWLSCCWEWNMVQHSSFVVLQSRGEIKNGTILRLAISPVSPLCLSHLQCVLINPDNPPAAPYFPIWLRCDSREVSAHKHLYSRLYFFALASTTKFLCLVIFSGRRARLRSTGERRFEKDNGRWFATVDNSI